MSLQGCKLASIFKPGAMPETFSASLDRESGTEAQHATSWSTSVDGAMQTAARENKLVMALFTGSDWCTWCTKLEKEVFEDPAFAKWASDHVVPLKLDFPQNTQLPRAQTEQNESMRQRYRKYVKGYPSILFLDDRGEVVAKMGYAKGGPDAWISQAEAKLRR